MSRNFFDSESAEQQTSDSEGSVSSSSSGDSIDAEQAAGLKPSDKKDDASKPMLSALEAFDEIEGPPDFLDPEAIRPSHEMSQKKRKAPSFHETREAEKKLRQSVITAKPVTYKTPRVPEVTPLTPDGKKDGSKAASKPMAVDEFLTKGGGVMLPRRTRFQRDKEKAKREKGQSSHSAWKSEEEMLLRQQYD